MQNLKQSLRAFGQNFMRTLKMSRAEFTKKLVYTATFVAFGILFPMVFHSLGPTAGRIILPMHIPVLLCGIICGWPFGIACGLLSAGLSHLFTQMPPMAMLPSMLCELTIYGGVSGLLFHFVRTKNTVLDLYIVLISSMLLGRAAYGVLNALIFNVGAYSFSIWVTAAFVTSLPGIIIQILLIPSLVLTFEKLKLIPVRYAPEKEEPPKEAVPISS